MCVFHSTLWGWVVYFVDSRQRNASGGFPSLISTYSSSPLFIYKPAADTFLLSYNTYYTIISQVKQASVYCTCNTRISNAHWSRRLCFDVKERERPACAFPKPTSCQNHSSRAFSKHTHNKNQHTRGTDSASNVHRKIWNRVMHKLQLHDSSKPADLIPNIIQPVRIEWLLFFALGLLLVLLFHKV